MYLSVAFANNWAWFLMVLPLLMIGYKFFIQKSTISSVNVSNLPKSSSNTLKVLLRKLIDWLPILASIFLIIAIARPQDEEKNSKRFTEGIDIVMAIDVSTSMLEKDFSPNRLESAKKVAKEFVDKRPNDRIGVVVFAGESYVQCPPTIDHNVVLKQIDAIKNGIIEDGTAIGMGLATSVRSLQNSNAKSKVCILLTDGVNTAGTIDPYTAIDIAKAFKIKTYCIGVGTDKGNILGIDEKLMKKISNSTGGIYFRAGSDAKLKQIYDKINQLETQKIEVASYQKRNDLFFPYALIGFGLFVFYLLLKNTWLKGV